MSKHFEPGDAVEVLVATRDGPRWIPGVVQSPPNHNGRVRVRVKHLTVLRFCHPSSVRARVEETT